MHRTFRFSLAWCLHIDRCYKYRRELQKSDARFHNLSGADFNAESNTYRRMARWTADNEAQRRLLQERVDDMRMKVIRLEIDMCIGTEERWSRTDPRYLKVLAYSQTRDFQRALDHLQKLVVQRLFELQRLNIAGTGTSYLSGRKQY